MSNGKRNSRFIASLTLQNLPNNAQNTINSCFLHPQVIDLKGIWKILGCCGNAKRHCRNDATRGAFAAMHFNIVAIHIAAMLKGIASSISIVATLRQYEHWNRHCGNTPRHCSNMGIAAMPWGIVAIPHCGNAMRHCYSIVVARSLWWGCQLFPLAPRRCGGAVSFCW